MTLLLALCAAATLPLAALDTSHFYRAQFFPGEPRFERKALTTGSFVFGGGTTTNSFNERGGCVPLLDLYGPFNMKNLGLGIPLDPANTIDQILLQLQALPNNGTFGTLSFSALFDIFEARLSWFQNIDCGFFFGFYLPIRTLSITSIEYHDLSPKEGFPSRTTPAWQEFLRNFSDILIHYKRSLRSARTDGVGDIGIIAGWTRNEESFEWCDYCDCTLWSGVLIPTQSPLLPRTVFALPLGYGGYTVIPVMADLSVGFCEWITIGGHADAHILLHRNAIRAIKTDPQQSGMLKLAQACVTVYPGVVWSADVYAKADHIMGGLSVLLGYGYSHQQKTSLKPLDTGINATIINNDPQLAGWTMNTLHLMAEYDFASYEAPYAPRIAIIYNRVLSGKRIFDTNITGGSCVIEYSWGF